MIQIRLIHGPPVQIEIPEGTKRSKPGAIHLVTGNPVFITAGEANYIKGEMGDPKSHLSTLQLKIDKLPEPKPKAKAAKPKMAPAKAPAPPAKKAAPAKKTPGKRKKS